jgi:hypothetical protein
VKWFIWPQYPVEPQHIEGDVEGEIYCLIRFFLLSVFFIPSVSDKQDMGRLMRVYYPGRILVSFPKLLRFTFEEKKCDCAVDRQTDRA